MGIKKHSLKYLDIQRYLLNYFAGVRFVFKKWNFRFSISEKKINIIYFQDRESILNCGEDINITASFSYSKISKQWKRELVYNIQDFVISCFYNYEWDGRKVKLKVLSCLMGVSMENVRLVIEKVLNEINIKYGNKFLQ